MKFFLVLKKAQWGFFPIFNTKEFENENGYRKLFIFLFCFACIISLFFLSNDLWQDELYTLQHFVLVPLDKTLTDYHSTNNHIVFNFLANIYLKLITVNDINVLLANPGIIRILPFTLTMFSVLILFKGSKNNFGYLFATIVTIIYITSIQFYTFGSQVRGYSLSLLLMMIVLNQIFTSFRKPQLHHLIILSVSGFLLLVNLPSSLYLFLSFVFILFIELLIKYFKNQRTNIFKTLHILFALSISLLLAGIFFWFKKNQLSNNSLLQNSGNDIIKLIKQPLTVYYRLLDLRLFLLIPFTVFIIKFGLNKIYISTFLFGLLIFPFIIYMFHNPTIILRIWIVVLPVFCYFFATILLSFIKYKHLIKITIPFLCILIISLLTLKYQMKNKFALNKAPLDLKYQYHLFGYEPFETALKAKQFQNDLGAKILLNDMYWGGIKYYLPDYLTTKNELTNQTAPIFLISDHLNEMNSFLQYDYHVTDSGYNNQFYKWYLLKKKYD